MALHYHPLIHVLLNKHLTVSVHFPLISCGTAIIYLIIWAEDYIGSKVIQKHIFAIYNRDKSKSAKDKVK